jgi:hypothetical protein
MPKKRLLIKPRPVTMKILPPVESFGYNRKTKDALMENVRMTMCDKLKKLKGEQACS